MRNKIAGANCSACPFYSCAFVPPAILPDSDTIIVGEAPGSTEAIKLQPFVGDSGKLLRNVLGSRASTVSYTNVVMCKPPNNVIKDTAIAACKGHLSVEIAGKNVLAVGQVAQNTVLDSDYRRGTLKRLDDGTRISSTFHPAAVLRNPELYLEFHDNVQMFLRNLDTPTFSSIIFNALPLHGGKIIIDVETNSVDDTDLILVGAMPVDNGAEAYVLTEHSAIASLIDGLNAGHWQAVYHNAPFDVKVLNELGLSYEVPFDDTLVMHLMIREVPPHGLEDLARLVFGVDDYKKMLDRYNPKKLGFRAVPLEVLAEYNALDLAVTRLLYQAMRKVLTTDLYSNSIALQQALIVMQSHGIPIDSRVMSQAGDEMNRVMRLIAGSMNDALQAVQSSGRELVHSSKPIQAVIDGKAQLNPNSPLQVAWFLYDVLGFPVPKNGTSRGTGKEDIAELCNLYEHIAQHPVVAWLKEYRRISKLLSGYVTVMEKHEEIHANFLIHGTEIGRLATRNPTIHGIPRPDDYWGNFIRASVTKSGCKVVVADYSQIELRVAAMLSGEPVWTSAFKAGLDVHGQTASDIYGEGWTKAQRTYCKNFNFAYLYGGNEHSFASQVNLPIEKATEFVQIYKSKMQRLESWKRAVEDEALRRGYVENPFGRRRRFQYVNSVNEKDVRKQALHFLVSSTASDICTRALTKLMSNLSLNIVASIHDSIIGIEPSASADEFGQLYVDVMRSVAYEYFPDFWWGVDVEVSNRWSPYPVMITVESASALGLSGKPPYRYTVVPENLPSFLSMYAQEDVINLWTK